MGRPAYSHRAGGGLPSCHWAMRTAVVRTWPRRPRWAIWEARRT